MTEEQVKICKEVLRKFIYKIKVSAICKSVFHYYNDSLEKDGVQTYPINSPEYFASFNYERVKRQIRKKILSNRNNYWNLEDKNIKIVENICINTPNEFDNFKEYINYLWNCSLEEQTREFEIEKQKAKEQDDAILKIVLGNKFETHQEVVNLILQDTNEYPYKSDKIKILLELELDVDTIFKVLQLKEKWNAPRSYIDKYYKERQEGIQQKKIVVYELGSTIKHVISQLRHNNS